MGYVDQVYISKINQVQGVLASAASRAGFASLSFAQVLGEAETKTQNTLAGGSGNTSVNNKAVVASGINTASDTQYDSIIQEAAQKNGLDANLIKAVVKVESSFHKDAVSRCGAIGLMQLMPGTAKELKVSDPYDPVQNINGGAAYLKKQLNRFGDVRLALAAYNTGPGRIASLHITNPDDPGEYSKISQGVRNYVDKALSYYEKYAST